MAKAPMSENNRRELMAMSPRRRIILCLHYHEGVTVDEIADIVGVPPAEVRWHLSESTYVPETPEDAPCP